MVTAEATEITEENLLNSACPVLSAVVLQLLGSAGLERKRGVRG
jgi:hypothetical protein